MLVYQNNMYVFVISFISLRKQIIRSLKKLTCIYVDIHFSFSYWLSNGFNYLYFHLCFYAFISFPITYILFSFGLCPRYLLFYFTYLLDYLLSSLNRSKLLLCQYIYYRFKLYCASLTTIRLVFLNELVSAIVSRTPSVTTTTETHMNKIP